MENKLETPFGTLEVLRNGEAKDYRIKENDNNLFVPSEEEIDAEPMHPEGCVTIVIDISKCEADDQIIVRFDTAPEFNFGRGSERGVNVNAVKNNYIIGMGCLDTGVFGYAMYPPYELTGLVQGGLQFRVSEDIKNPAAPPVIEILLVWEPQTNRFAKEMVAQLTC
ncbi:MAG: hypothetical protein PUC26_08630 [Eubacteriales bacterium]|nr:hypothetical protein [Eubacteriales bacterium]